MGRRREERRWKERRERVGDKGQYVQKKGRLMEKKEG